MQKMWRLLSWILIVGGSLVIVSVSSTPVTLLGESDLPLLTSSVEIEGKPVRPRLFQSPEQIRTYLDTLGKYYSYHNRNRFGKRMMVKPRNPYREIFESKPFQEYDTRSIP